MYLQQRTLLFLYISSHSKFHMVLKNTSTEMQSLDLADQVCTSPPSIWSDCCDNYLLLSNDQEALQGILMSQPSSIFDQELNFLQDLMVPTAATFTAAQHVLLPSQSQPCVLPSECFASLDPLQAIGSVIAIPNCHSDRLTADQKCSSTEAIARSGATKRKLDNCDGNYKGGLEISFKNPRANCNIKFSSESSEIDTEAIAQVKEMIYRAAAMRPVLNLGAEEEESEGLERPKRRRNVKISSEPQTVAARQRRERISERLRMLQKLVPGGSKMDTATMLEEAANYLKFLKSQIRALETLGSWSTHPFSVPFSMHARAFSPAT